MKIKNILIVGKPGCGKTTLVKDISKDLNSKISGFYTEEMREKGKRVGFKIKTLDQKEGILAHIDLKTPYRVGKYKVNLKDLEEIGVVSIEKAIKQKKIVLIDEIGKMELFSDKFKKAIIEALNSENRVLATIMLKKNSFCDRIKKRKDVKIFYLKRANFEEIKKEIEKILLS
ncbi:NTPase [bacterium]|nr:NTPase [bacterium]